MIHSYDEALSWIHSRLRLGIKPGLKRMEWMMERLEHPEKKIKAIHVGGTNGKGSTVSYLRNMLQSAGYCVGTFTSPFVESFNERISVNGKPIEDEEIVFLLNKIKPLAEELEKSELGSPTEFEVITVMAFYYFSINLSVDFVIMEVGLGGRLDSTNIVTPLLSIITNIGHDHMNILGDSIAEIAYEKAGIIKEHTPVISWVDQREAIEQLEKKAVECEADFYLANRDFIIKGHNPLDGGEEFSLQTPFHWFPDLQISMLGSHQVKNASLAVMAVSLLITKGWIHLPANKVQEGLKRAKWIGRFEQICSKPTIILDGAHNQEGVESLVKTIDSHFTGKTIHIIFCAMKDKDLTQMIQQLEEIADRLVFTTFDFPRVSSTKELYECSSASERIRIIDNWQEAINKELDEVSIEQETVLLITGSLYFLSEIRPYLLKKCESNN